MTNINMIIEKAREGAYLLAMARFRVNSMKELGMLDYNYKAERIQVLAKRFTAIMEEMAEFADLDGSDEARSLAAYYVREMMKSEFRFVVELDISPEQTAYALEKLNELGEIDQNKDTAMEL